MIQEIRETIRRIYAKCDTWLQALGKFLLAFLCFWVIRSSLGQTEALNSLILLLILALACSFLPLNTIVLFGTGLILGHLYGISLAALALGGGLLAIVLLLYFGLAPGHALALILTPLALALRIPLAVPIAFGLLSTPFAGFGMAAGTIGYYGLRTILAEASTFGEGGQGLAVQELLLKELQETLRALIGNSEMFLALITLTAVLVVVFAVRRMEVKYAWQLAIGTGIFIDLAVEAFGMVTLELPVSAVDMAVGTVIPALIGVILQLFFFDLDYRRTEKLQFEDDDYYYYVTAVPKRKQERTVDEWTQ